jgi:hypothetical protein
MIAERSDEAIVLARRLLHMAVELGFRDIEAAALETTGVAKVLRSGDSDGLADLERAIRLIEQLPSGSLNLAFSYNNLATALASLGDLPRCFATRAAAERAAERHGALHRLRWMELERVAEHYWSGRWDETLRRVDAMVLETARGKGHALECVCRVWRGRIRLARGETSAALADSAAALDLGRASSDPQDLDAALAFGARALLVGGRPQEAGPLVDELLKNVDGRLLPADVGIDLPLALVELDYPVQALDGVLKTRWHDAARALVGGDARRADLRRHRLAPGRGRSASDRRAPASGRRPGHHRPVRAGRGDRLLPGGRGDSLPAGSRGAATCPGVRLASLGRP